MSDINKPTGNEPMGRFLWLPPGVKPPVPLPRRQEIVFLLVGTTLLFSGYDLNVYGLAIPQIQQSLNIPENEVGPLVSYFRLALIPAMMIALTADLFGRRRLLLFTVFFEALFTLLTALVQDREQYIAAQIAARVFGYCDEMLGFVVIAEEIDARVRGWGTGVLGAMNSTGAGVASLVFAAVNYLPYGWRAMYFLGGSVLLILAYYRRWLPETKRFEIRKEELKALGSKIGGTSDALRRLLHEYPGRVAVLIVTLFAFGLAVGPATVLMSKYLQQTHHYTPGQVSTLYVLGGFVAVVGNVLAGRLSDRLGRKPMIFLAAAVTASSFAVFFSGYDGPYLPAFWIMALFGYFSGDALLAGMAVEIVPTAYRATMGGLRYLTIYMGGALGLFLEGMLYDRYGAHGPAILTFLCVMPVALVSVLFLPEPARRVLEEIAPEPRDLPH
ncbi:MAG TPA: MFS transporter [Rhizomicrobium sp.]|nr:MFS transporter [Rhizomicrobium sp.]